MLDGKEDKQTRQMYMTDEELARDRGWNPVSKGYPAYRKRVLTVSEGGNMQVDWVFTQSQVGNMFWRERRADPVTHWMELPEGP